jgi:hypothetical protein
VAACFLQSLEKIAILFFVNKVKTVLLQLLFKTSGGLSAGH